MIEIPDWTKAFAEACETNQELQPNLVDGLRQAVRRRNVSPQLGLNVLAWATADEAVRDVGEEGAA